MSDLCEAPLNYGDGKCDFEASYPDGKCGIHSEHGRNGGRDLDDPDLDRFLTRERRRLSDGTYDTRLTGIRAFKEWLDVEGPDNLREIGPLEIEDFVIWAISDEGRDIAESTADKYAQQVSKFYQYLGKKGEDIENPVPEADLQLDTDSEMSKQLKDDTGYVAMSPDQFEQLMNHLPAPTTRNQLLMQLLWETGLRPKEATEIRYEEDIDREKREIQVRSTKTESNRVVFYGETVDTMLDIWLDRGERDRFNPAESSPYLFISQQSEKISRWSINNVFREAAREAELYDQEVYTDANGNPQYDLKPYSLRHGFAERMVDQGVDLETLRATLGHETIETTKRYVNPDRETRRLRIQKALDD